MAETVIRSGTVLPVKVLTARTQHACNDCPSPIEPGQKYELAVYPPHRIDVYDVDRWVTWRTHYPRHDGDRFLFGCDLAAAYREKAARERAEPCPACGGYEGGASSGPGAGCVCQDIEYLATLPPVLEDDDA
jgi:hypothetical protein